MPKTKKAKPKKKGEKKAKKESSSAKAPEISQEAEEMLMHRVLLWLNTNRARAVNLFQKFDTNNDNMLSTDEFFVGMRMMGAPVTRTEMDQLIKIIDTEEKGMLNLLEFDDMIRNHQRKLMARRQSSTVSDDATGSSSTSLTFSPSRVSEKCPHCSIGLAEPPVEWNPRYIKLKAILAPLKDIEKHPAHAQLKVMESTTIHGLKHLIREHLCEAVESVAFFRDASCSKSSFLPPTWCLGHCGLSGGLEVEPKPAVLFYDYVTLLDDCPIIMNDSCIT